MADGAVRHRVRVDGGEPVGADADELVDGEADDRAAADRVRGRGHAEPDGIGQEAPLRRRRGGGGDHLGLFGRHGVADEIGELRDMFDAAAPRDVDAQLVDDRVDVGAERHPDRRLRLFVPTDGADEVAHLLVRAEFEGERCLAEHVECHPAAILLADRRRERVDVADEGVGDPARRARREAVGHPMRCAGR